MASRTLPLALDDFDVDGAALEDFDAEFLDVALVDVVGFERDELDPFDEPDRLAGVLFLDDPQLDMSPPPYQPGVTADRYRPAGRCQGRSSCHIGV